MPTIHYHVVAAIIQHGGKLLCVQKGRAKYAYLSYKYEFPGGKVEEGESPQDALRREVREELLLDIEVGDEFLVVEHEYPDFTITLRSYLSTALHVDAPKLTEHIRYTWKLPGQLTELDWAAADLPIVLRLAEGGKKTGLIDDPKDQPE